MHPGRSSITNCFAAIMLLLQAVVVLVASGENATTTTVAPTVYNACTALQEQLTTSLSSQSAQTIHLNINITIGPSNSNSSSSSVSSTTTRIVLEECHLPQDVHVVLQLKHDSVAEKGRLLRTNGIGTTTTGGDDRKMAVLLNIENVTTRGKGSLIIVPPAQELTAMDNVSTSFSPPALVAISINVNNVNLQGAGNMLVVMPTTAAPPPSTATAASLSGVKSSCNTTTTISNVTMTISNAVISSENGHVFSIIQPEDHLMQKCPVLSGRVDNVHIKVQGNTTIHSAKGVVASIVAKHVKNSSLTVDTTGVVPQSTNKTNTAVKHSFCDAWGSVSITAGGSGVIHGKVGVLAVMSSSSSSKEHSSSGASSLELQDVEIAVFAQCSTVCPSSSKNGEDCCSLPARQQSNVSLEATAGSGSAVAIAGVAVNHPGLAEVQVTGCLTIDLFGSTPHQRMMNVGDSRTTEFVSRSRSLFAFVSIRVAARAFSAATIGGIALNTYEALTVSRSALVLDNAALTIKGGGGGGGGCCEEQPRRNLFVSSSVLGTNAASSVFGIAINSLANRMKTKAVFVGFEIRVDNRSALNIVFYANQTTAASEADAKKTAVESFVSDKSSASCVFGIAATSLTIPWDEPTTIFTIAHSSRVNIHLVGPSSSGEIALTSRVGGGASTVLGIAMSSGVASTVIHVAGNSTLSVESAEKTPFISTKKASYSDRPYYQHAVDLVSIVTSGYGVTSAASSVGGIALASFLLHGVVANATMIVEENCVVHIVLFALKLFLPSPASTTSSVSSNTTTSSAPLLFLTTFSAASSVGDSFGASTAFGVALTCYSSTAICHSRFVVDRNSTFTVSARYNVMVAVEKNEQQGCPITASSRNGERPSGNSSVSVSSTTTGQHGSSSAFGLAVNSLSYNSMSLSTIRVTGSSAFAVVLINSDKPVDESSSSLPSCITINLPRAGGKLRCFTKFLSRMKQFFLLRVRVRVLEA